MLCIPSLYAFYYTVFRRHGLKKRGVEVVTDNLQSELQREWDDQETPFPCLPVCHKAKYTMKLAFAESTSIISYVLLLDDSGNQASCDGSATLTDVEALSDVQSDRVEDLASHLDVISWHDHL